MTDTATLSSVAVSIAFRKDRRSVLAARAVPVRTTKGKGTGDISLDPSLFGVRPNMAVLHQVVTAQMAGARSGSHSTKRRSEVRGGGAKPWRQKGTGRARQGSIRAAQWVGGGIAMGPKPRRYAQSTPKKMVRLALASALSDRAACERVVVVDRWGFDAPSTKEAIAALTALKLSGKVLVVLGGESDLGADRVAFKSFANLPEVGIIPAPELTAWDVLRCDWLVFTRASLAAVPGSTPAPSSDPTPASTSGSAAASADQGAA